jgi:enhancing lycopene biosynthesis protein 2
MSKRIGVLLAGCGVYDGAEVQESVLTLLALAEGGAEAIYMAPDVDQAHVINHQTGEVMEGERRNVRVEAARIARGPVLDVAEVTAADIDGLVVPGGFGAAKNFCDYAFKGEQMEVNADVARLLREVHAAGKPIGMLCIAPVIAAKLFGDEQVKVTIGNDAATAGHIHSWGACHEDKAVSDAVLDTRLKIYTAPAYMLGPGVSEIQGGIRKVVAAVLADC